MGATDCLRFVLIFIYVITANGMTSWPWISQTPNFTISQDCAFLSPTPRYSSEWPRECYHLNVTIKSTQKTLTGVGDEFRDCFSGNGGNNVSHLDVNVAWNCVLTLVDGVNKTVLDGGKEMSSIDVSSLSTLTVTSCQCDIPSKVQNGSELVGITFSPYDKHPEECKKLDEDKSCLSPIHKKHVNWWSYTKEDIQTQLELVATEFVQISTYGIGTVEKPTNPPTYNTDWREGLPVALVPFTVAQMNMKIGNHKLKIIVGAYSHDGYKVSHLQAEVANAVGAARDAETLFPGTVKGVSIHFNAATLLHLDLVMKMLVSARSYAPNGGRTGVRLQDCDKAFNQLYNRREESSHLFCKPSDSSCSSSNPLQLNPLLEPLIRTAHFVICFLRPQSSLFVGQLNLTMPEIVKNFGNHVLEMRNALEKVNPNTEFILETGWPSQGRSGDGSPNSLRNMKDYWVLIVEWTKSQGLRSFMFEAFDQPWKIDLSLQGRNESRGICGAENHYGWWRRKDNSNPGVYIRKLDIEDVDDKYSTIDPGTFPEDCPLEESPEKAEEKVLVMVIIIAAVVFAFLVFGLGYMAFRLRRPNSDSLQEYLKLFREGMDSNSARTVSGNDDDYQVIAFRFPYDKRKYELDEGTFKIDLSKPIGKGQSGTVYLGEVYKTQVDNSYVGPVAFKSSDSTSSISDIKNFMSEIKIMSYIGQHENIICLIGAYTEKLERGIVHLALEYCKLGSLDKFLQGNGKFKPNYVTDEVNVGQQLNYVTTACLDSMSSSSSCRNGADENCGQIEFDFTTMVSWSWQIANGMEYLADKKVVHADMACRNILLTMDMSIKITDFGLSQKFYTEISPNLVFESDVALPWRWMAPESLHKLVFSTESDVYSFGTTIWEIFSLGDVPFAGEVFCSQFVLDLENGKRLDEPGLATDELHDLMDECWASNPSDRPNFTRLKESLGKLL